MRKLLPAVAALAAAAWVAAAPAVAACPWVINDGFWWRWFH
jgi:hypothetical protein